MHRSRLQIQRVIQRPDSVNAGKVHWVENTADAHVASVPLMQLVCMLLVQKIFLKDVTMNIVLEKFSL